MEALLALGQAGTFVTSVPGLPFHALATRPSQSWPAGNCPCATTGSWVQAWTAES